jgi:hypothetical protein
MLARMNSEGLFAFYYAVSRQTRAHRHSKNTAVTAGKRPSLYLMGGVKRKPDSHAQPVS